MTDSVAAEIIRLNEAVVERYQAGRYQEALPLALQACELARQQYGDGHPELAASLGNLASVYESLALYSQAESPYREAVEIYRAAPPEYALFLAGALNNLAFLQVSMGNYPAARSLYQEALAIWCSQPEKAELAAAQMLNSLGQLHQTLGDYPMAKTYLQQALRIRRRLGGQHPILARSLNNLAELYREIGQYARAERLYRRALNIQQAVLDQYDLDTAFTLNNLGALYRAQRRYADAVPLYEQAIQTWRAVLGDNHPLLAASLNNLGVVYRVMGEYGRAEPLLQQALEIRQKAVGETHPDVATSLHNIAGLYAATGRISAAFERLKQSAAIYDRMITQVFSIGSDRQRLAYLAALRGVFESFLSLVYQHRQALPAAVWDALDLILRRKAIDAEALAAQRDAILGGRYPHLSGKLDELVRLRQQIAQKTLAGPGSEGLRVYRQQLAEWSRQQEQWESELAQQIPELRLEDRLRIAARASVAETLLPESVLVEFVRFDVVNFQAVPGRGDAFWQPARYLAFVLPAGEPDKLQMIDLGEAEGIDRLIANFRAAITGDTYSRGNALDQSTPVAAVPVPAEPGLASLRGSISEAARHVRPVSRPKPSQSSQQWGEELRAKLWDPLVPYLDRCTRLFMAPDGDLARLPFEILPLQDGRRVIDDYRISYLSVGRDVLRFGALSGRQPSPPLVLADPDYDLGAELPRSTPFRRLPGTRQEGEQVAAKLQVQPLLDREVLEQPLKAQRSPRILHLATHGFFLPSPEADPHLAPSSSIPFSDELGRLSTARLENPLLRSGLALAGANTWLNGGMPPDPAENGILLAEDVTGMDLLDTELVVLSACETGLGDINEERFIARVEAANAEELASILANPSPEEEQALRKHLGNERYERQHALAVASTARTRAAQPLKGNVVVLPGVMGSDLANFTDAGEPDLIWVNLFRMIGGAVEVLQLDDEGRNGFRPNYNVRSAGIFKRHYGTMLLALARNWNVVGFGYDWRKDLNQTAADLERQIRDWFGEQPVHLVAHSLGGLLARTFIKNYPRRWAKMWDAQDNGRRGGRLIMLGTPNHGAVSIVQAVTGIQDMIQKLAVVDVHHNLDELLVILHSFPSLYQVLPSPLATPEMVTLYQAATFRCGHVPQRHLDSARQHHQHLSGVVDVDRMLYVAGYNRPTASGIRDFAAIDRWDGYEVTPLGDGSVTHASGRPPRRRARPGDHAP